MTLRKWRFPILIGGGLIAAAVLVYFSGVRIHSEKAQGAIGKRDVYRDGKVDSADVGQAGSAPVAIQAVLESSEFKALASNPAFQDLLKSDAFKRLATNELFMRLLHDSSFQELAKYQAFSEMAKSDLLRRAVASGQDLHEQDLRINDLLQRAQFREMVQSRAFHELLHNEAFAQMLNSRAFADLLSSASFQNMMRDGLFARLASQAAFQNALLQGNAANLVNRMVAR